MAIPHKAQHEPTESRSTILRRSLQRPQALVFDSSQSLFLREIARNRASKFPGIIVLPLEFIPVLTTFDLFLLQVEEDLRVVGASLATEVVQERR